MCNLQTQNAPVGLNDLSVEAISANQIVSVPANANRRFLLIAKRGSGQAFLKFKGTPTSPFRDCIQLVDNGAPIVFDKVVPTDAFEILITTVSNSVVIYEGEIGS